MQELIIKIIREGGESIKLVTLNTGDLINSYHEGLGYDFADTLERIYEAHKHSNLIIKIVNTKNEPIGKEIMNAVGIFSRRVRLMPSYRTTSLLV